VTKETILVIQENKKSAYLLDFLLSREGYEVIATTGCYEAETLMGKIQPPKLIILDAALSSANNNKMIALIKQKPDWLNTPVLLLTSHYNHSQINSALNAGASDFIVEPFSHSELLTHIERHSLYMH
jgi:CheY-like chemotaxis protein